MMLQEKAESQTLQTAGSGTKTKSGKKPAELDRTVIADDLDDADAEEKGKGLFYKTNQLGHMRNSFLAPLFLDKSSVS